MNCSVATAAAVSGAALHHSQLALLLLVGLAAAYVTCCDWYPRDRVAKTAGSAHGPWHTSLTPALHVAIPGTYLASLGLPSLGPPSLLAGSRA